MSLTTKKQILDPISSMCHIATLSFKPNSTKIGINDHTITVQDPGYLQWIYRNWYRDNRESIGLLYNMVIRMIEWYIIPLSGKYRMPDDNKSTIFDNIHSDEKRKIWGHRKIN